MRFSSDRAHWKLTYALARRSENGAAQRRCNGRHWWFADTARWHVEVIVDEMGALITPIYIVFKRPRVSFEGDQGYRCA